MPGVLLDKTQEWAADRGAPLPARLAALQADNLLCLGNAVPWLGQQEDRVLVHARADIAAAAGRSRVLAARGPWTICGDCGLRCAFPTEGAPSPPPLRPPRLLAPPARPFALATWPPARGSAPGGASRPLPAHRPGFRPGRAGAPGRRRLRRRTRKPAGLRAGAAAQAAGTLGGSRLGGWQEATRGRPPSAALGRRNRDGALPAAPSFRAAWQALSRERRRGRTCPSPRGGALCQRKNEAIRQACNRPLDRKGWHAIVCKEGESRNDRHNRPRGWRCKRRSAHRMRCPLRAMRARWGRRLPNGRLEEAELDVAAVDRNAGRRIFVDRAVTCAHSTYAPRR